MKKLKLFVFSLMSFFVMEFNVNAKTMTSEELIATASDGTITLTEDIELTTNLAFSSQDDVKKLDLGGHTLTLVAVISGQDGEKTTNPIAVFDTTVEIKNGTIKRDTSLTRGGLVLVGDKNKGADAHIILTDVVLDGNNVATSAFDATLKNGDWIYYDNNYQIRGIGAALYVGYGADVTLTNTTVKNHNGSIAVNLIGAGNVVFNNSKIINNNAQAVSATGTKISFEKTVVSDNKGNVQIGNSEEFIFDSESVIKNNISISTGGLEIQNNKSDFVMKATISGTIEGNEAKNPDGDVANGGGVYIITTNPNSVVTFTKTAKIINNIAGGAGGGIYINSYKDSADALMTPGKVIIDGATITGNTAKATPDATTLKDGGGAGIYVARGIAEIKDAIIKDNVSTSGKGSAILVSHAGGAMNGGKLTIKNATVNGDIILGQYLDGETKKDAGSIVINAGTYSTDVKDYVATGLVSRKVGDVYVVATERTINIGKVSGGAAEVDITKAVVGEAVTITLKPEEGYLLNTLKVLDANNKEVEVKDNKFVMPDSNVTVSAEFIKATITTEIPVVGETNEVGIKDAAKVEEVLLETLGASADEKVKDALKDTNVKVEVEVEDVVANESLTTDFEKVLADEKLNNAKVVNYFDITVAVKNANTGEEITTLPELTKAIELMVAVPELEEVKEGYVREYYIIREHDGKVELIKDVTLSEDGKYLVFESSEFSTYALAYNDVVDTKVPETGDNILYFVALGFMSIAAIGMAYNNLKKRANR